jgi:hypothetical protein
MNKIQSYRELEMEKNRLRGVLVVQKELIITDFQFLKEKYKPSIQVLSVAARLLNKDTSNPLVSMLVNVAGDVLLRNTLLSTSGKITRFVVPLLFRKASSFFFSPNGNSILHKLTGGWKKKSNGVAEHETRDVS